MQLQAAKAAELHYRQPNQADGGNGLGGGIFAAILSIADSTITGNSATAGLGGPGYTKSITALPASLPAAASVPVARSLLIPSSPPIQPAEAFNDIGGVPTQTAKTISSASSAAGYSMA